jgi:succinate-semialdehyde dehydrogenase/glutarate-semialdehyde dehydrogenase
VHRSVLEEFSEKLTEKLAAMKVGDGLREDVEVGPLIEPKAIEKVERHVADAKEKGAKVVLGGEKLEGANGKGGGNFFAPTVLTDADDTMLVAKRRPSGRWRRSCPSTPKRR